MMCSAVCEEQSQRIEPSLKALEIEDSDDEMQCKDDTVIKNRDMDVSDDEGIYVAWDSGNVGSNGHEAGSKLEDPLLEDEVVQHLKDAGNACFKVGKYHDALKHYVDAVEACEGKTADTGRQPTKAVLHSNISATLLKMNRFQEAMKHANIAQELDSTWSKPLYRMATIHLAMGDYAAAMEACQQGEALCKAGYHGITEFTPLYDKIVIHGSVGGQADALFTGRRLEVRSAGEEAWLGKPAPHIPELDGPLDESTALPSDDLDTIQETKYSGASDALKVLGDSSHGARGDGLVDWNFAETKLAIQSTRTSYRCIKEAYEAARDGDRILLLRGTHNGMGETVCIKKRVLIEGEGRLGEVVIDQRANNPTFRIERGGVLIRNLDIDHTGFREAILIDGSEYVNPLIERCDIKCSGDDCLNVGGKAKPILRQCRLQGKKAGIRCFESSEVTLDRCIVESCGTQGLEIMDNSRVMGHRCLIQKCAEDGVVVMSNAKCSLVESRIIDNKGPGVDCSDRGFAALSRCEILNNTAGCWSWDSSTIRASACKLSGGTSQIILAHDNGKVYAKSCDITGGIHAPGKAWEDGLLNNDNTFHDPENPIDFPIESGAFVFVPSPYTSI